MDNGFNSPTTDEPLAGNPRVHEEGRSNYERNNRSSDWFAHSNEILDIKSESRIKSDSARANAAARSHENGQEDLKQNHTHSQDVKLEAPVNTDSVKIEVVNNHVENHFNLEVTPKSVPKVKSVETEEHREQVSSSSSVSNGSSAATPDSEQPPPPRLALSVGDKAIKQKGEPAGKVNGTKTSRESKQGRLHQESIGSGWDQSPPHHRLRADGEGIARKNKADSITDIILQNSPEVKEPRVAVKNVPDTYTPRKPPTPRIRPDGLQNLQKAMNHSEMSAIMHGSPVESAPPRPSSGRKVLPHMQRSELW